MDDVTGARLGRPARVVGIFEVDPILEQARQQTRWRQRPILEDDAGLGGEGVEQLAPKPLEDAGVAGLIGSVVDILHAHHIVLGRRNRHTRDERQEHEQTQDAIAPPRGAIRARAPSHQRPARSRP